jgi:hypothetical protein
MEGEWVWRDFLNGNLVSDELGKILEKLASPIAKHRYQSVKEVMQELNFVDQNVRRSPSQILPPPPPPSQPPVKIPQPSVTVPNQYQKLEKLLAAGKWKEADEETIKVMLIVANREKQRWLNVKSIDNFPCVDLRTIDGLWVKYSNGRFGFSVQKRIYQSLGANEIAFGDRVGWRRKVWLGMGLWKYYHELTFDITAPQAHLPGCISLNIINIGDTTRVRDSFRVGIETAVWAERFFSRVETCGL